MKFKLKISTLIFQVLIFCLVNGNLEKAPQGYDGFQLFNPPQVLAQTKPKLIDEQRFQERNFLRSLNLGSQDSSQQKELLKILQNQVKQILSNNKKKKTFVMNTTNLIPNKQINNITNSTNKIQIGNKQYEPQQIEDSLRIGQLIINNCGKYLERCPNLFSNKNSSNKTINNQVKNKTDLRFNNKKSESSNQNSSLSLQNTDEQYINKVTKLIINKVENDLKLFSRLQRKIRKQKRLVRMQKKKERLLRFQKKQEERLAKSSKKQERVQQKNQSSNISNSTPTPKKTQQQNLTIQHTEVPPAKSQAIQSELVSSPEFQILPAQQQVLSTNAFQNSQIPMVNDPQPYKKSYNQQIAANFKSAEILPIIDNDKQVEMNYFYPKTTSQIPANNNQFYENGLSQFQFKNVASSQLNLNQQQQRHKQSVIQQNKSLRLNASNPILRTQGQILPTQNVIQYISQQQIIPQQIGFRQMIGSQLNQKGSFVRQQLMGGSNLSQLKQKIEFANTNLDPQLQDHLRITQKRIVPEIWNSKIVEQKQQKPQINLDNYRTIVSNQQSLQGQKYETVIDKKNLETINIQDPQDKIQKKNINQQVPLKNQMLPKFLQKNYDPVNPKNYDLSLYENNIKLDNYQSLDMIDLNQQKNEIPTQNAVKQVLKDEFSIMNINTNNNDAYQQMNYQNLNQKN